MGSKGACVDSLFKRCNGGIKCSVAVYDRMWMRFSLPFSFLYPPFYLYLFCFSLGWEKNHNYEPELLIKLVLNQCLGNKLASIPTQS